MNIDRYIILFLSTLASLRMALWLFKPSTHKGIAIGLYDKRRVTAKSGSVKDDIDNADVIGGNRYVKLDKILATKRLKNQTPKV